MKIKHIIITYVITFLCLNISLFLYVVEAQENHDESTEATEMDSSQEESSTDETVLQNNDAEYENDIEPGSLKNSATLRNSTDAPPVEEIALPKSPIEQNDSFQTSLFTGSATHSYPIKVPPGTAGLAPQLSLTYNSSSRRRSWVGLGWDIGQNYVQRDVNYTPGKTSDDKFELNLNGQNYKLVYDGSRFHTKVESYLYIQKVGNGWTVKTKDGTTYRFGYRADSENQCSYRNSFYGKYTWRWYLDEIVDTNGNHIYFYYQENPSPTDVGATYLQRIVYNNDEKRVVEFVLEASDRPDLNEACDNGCGIQQSRRLKEMRIRANGELVRKYVLNYTLNNSTISLLRSITEYGRDNAPYLSTEFQYTPQIQEWDGTIENWLDSGDNTPRLDDDVTLSDVNGDSLPDIVETTWVRGTQWNPSRVEWWVWLNQGDHWSTQKFLWLKDENAPRLYNVNVTLSDANGDGFPDIVESTSKLDGNVEWKVWLNQGDGWSTRAVLWLKEKDGPNLNNNDVSLSDVNGDGLPDIVESTSKLDGNAEWEVWLNQGDGWSTGEVLWLKEKNGPRLNDDNVILVDVNGDSLPDIVRSQWNGAMEEWWVRLNRGDGWSINPSR